MFRVCQELRDAVSMAGDMEHLVQSGLTDVKAHDNDFFTHKGQTAS